MRVPRESYFLLFLSVLVNMFAPGMSSHNGGLRIKRYSLFPEDSGMGVFLAISIPLDLEDKEVSISFNFEANYFLPSNASELEIPIIEEGREGADSANEEEEMTEEESLDEHQETSHVHKRSLSILTRANTYQMLEEKMESEGLPGRECLLRCICQAAETPLGHNGLVGQLLHILLTPSSSIYEPELNADFLQAEEDGLRGEDCEELYSNCPWKVLEVFTTLDTL